MRFVGDFAYKDSRVSPDVPASTIETTADDAIEVASLAEPSDGSPAPEPRWKPWLAATLLALVLWITFGLKLENLDHPTLELWDESHHAVVAQNVYKHPLKPTLVDQPYLPYDYRKWGENHVWLHKPILAFWQIALSFAILGVDTFALRLPSVILSTGAAGLTYLIGRELFDRRTALIAATLQAANPFLLQLVHGFRFADAIDISLLFWAEVGLYFLVRSLRTGSWRDVIIAGVAQGFAYLSKSYLAGIVFGVALTAWLLPILRLAKPTSGDGRPIPGIDFLRLIVLLGATLATVAPWMIYCEAVFPQEFEREHSEIFRHLFENVEGWGAPWDRVVFDYLIAIYDVFYTPVLVAMIALAGKAIWRRHMGLWLCYAWALGVVLPHLYAASKTPSATILALPACLLIFGHLVAEASRGERWPLAALAAILLVSVMRPAVIRSPGYGYPDSRAFGVLMNRAFWVVEHVVSTLYAAAALATVALVVRALWPRLCDAIGPFVRYALSVFCLGALLWLGYQLGQAAVKVVERPPMENFFWIDAGRFVRAELPENAVLVCEETAFREYLTAMFYTDRTSYAAQGQAEALARQIVGAGGVPYIVSHRRLPLPVVYAGQRHGRTIYQWQQAQQP
jgi:4-amino-4-deoxy-L-arabinose transferase-like glycosyltransferase